MRASEFITEAKKKPPLKGGVHNVHQTKDGRINGRLIPRQRWSINPDLESYDFYRALLQWGNPGMYQDVAHNTNEPRVVFYSRQEYESFCEFLKSQGISCADVSDYADNKQEEDTVHVNSPVPSPGFRDIF